MINVFKYEKSRIIKKIKIKNKKRIPVQRLKLLKFKKN